MGQLLDAVETSHAVDLTTVPKLNLSVVHGPKRPHLAAYYFDDLSIYLMFETDKRDFYLFKHNIFDPVNQIPMTDLDLGELHAELA